MTLQNIVLDMLFNILIEHFSYIGHLGKDFAVVL